MVDLLLGASVVFLLLVILGTMREVMLLRGEVVAMTNLVTRPSAPTYVGAALPTALHSAARLVTDTNSHGNGVLAFLSSSCSSCADLVRDLRRETSALQRTVLVVSAQSAEDPLAVSARSISGLVVLDRHGDLFSEAEITATPSMIAFRVDTLEAYASQTGGDVQWLRDALQQSTNEQRGSQLALRTATRQIGDASSD